MNNRQGLPSSLPARPNFATPAQAGPSQPRPLQQVQQRQNYSSHHHNPQQHQSHAQPPQITSYQTNSFAGQGQYGGYQPQPQYGYNQPIVGGGGYNGQYGMMAGYPANVSGGYPNQSMYQQPVYLNQSFGQSLFQQQPQFQNSGEYSYSSTYTNPTPMSMIGTQPPMKKQRTSNQQSNISSAPNGNYGAELAGSSTGTETGTWRNCVHPGCKFVGPSEKVQIHEEDRHLIFAKGKIPERSEEEERYAKRKGPPPPIQGTNITLNTPEEIEKWIAERKAKWPSAKRVKEKEEERDAAIARGDIPVRGRNKNGKFGKERKSDAASLAEEWGRKANPPPSSAYDETKHQRSEGSDRGRGRGRGNERGRGRGRGRGGYQEQSRESVDRGWGQITTLPGHEATPKASIEAETATKPHNNALSALEGYDTPTSSSASSSDSSDSSSESDSESDSDSEDELSSNASSNGEREPKEEKPEKITIKQKEQLVAEKEKEVPKSTCKFFMRQGKCKFGDKCRNLHHVDGNTPNSAKLAVQGDRKPLPRQPVQKKQNHFARPSMLGSLLSNPIQNTISQISQTIRFLVANDMLEGVELNPGDAKLQEDEKNKVKELDRAEEVERDSA
ncbi:uncharacterized protein L201_002890 [Kwoniella dendrophila CBS 6074]|uniref:C3H1-type domain-containing protein n=1 Tax=Kwoniella dendrophila CBS 6074 TaxID=1295534 RepID=A0AAX4JU21_9TREE